MLSRSGVLAVGLLSCLLPLRPLAGQSGSSTLGAGPEDLQGSAASLAWSTFLGSGLALEGGIAVSPGGEIYVVSDSGVAWGNPVSPFVPGGSNVFVAKLGSSGNLIWNSFMGAKDNVYGVYGYAIALDTAGAAYVTGYSTASWGNPRRAFVGGDRDAFVAKVDRNGQVQWNTFLGGAKVDEGHGISVDTLGNIYVTGESSATWGNPLTPFGLIPGDAFIAKLDPTGALVWSTFCGGFGGNRGEAVTTSADGSIFVTGQSNMSWGSPQRPYQWMGDAFAAKLNPSGTLVWNTFLGGSSVDDGRGIAVDGAGSAYVTGYSQGSWGSPRVPFVAGKDVFVARLSPSGALLWSTFMGGSGWDEGHGIATDAASGVVVTGLSETTWGEPLTRYGGGASDAFVARLDSSGSRSWHAFLGGPTYDWDLGVATDRQGGICIGGASGATWGSPLHAFTGSSDVFVARVVGASSPAHVVRRRLRPAGG
jgi:hypothetical protein